MRRFTAGFPLLFLALPLLSGCHAIGEKSASLSIIYSATVLLSVLALLGYFCIAKKKDPWFLLLFISVMVVNIGYFTLAISRSVDEALLANRVSYLGSVFLPLSMWMIIANVANIRLPKWAIGILLGISILVFFVAASPGYLDIYYQDVSISQVNGVTVLEKVYGPLHSLYLIYLLGYFTAIIITIICATLLNKIKSLAYAAILAMAVFVNIGVWLVEQLVHIDFEILSVSYIISESFILGLHLLMAENEARKQPHMPEVTSVLPEAVPKDTKQADQAKIDCFIFGVHELTGKERMIYECYIAGKSTNEIMEQLNIKENTLKFHNKNIYSKLGVSSRKQLLEIHKSIHAASDRQ